MEERKDSFNQIRLADDRNQIAVVIELCRKHLRQFPKHGPAWLRYGMALVALARYAEAEKALKKALKLCPPKKLSIPYMQMGNLIEAKGDFKKAATWYRKAAKLSPQDADYQNYLGHNAWKRGLHKQSEAHYRRALKCPKDAWMKLILIWVEFCWAEGIIPKRSNATKRRLRLTQNIKLPESGWKMQSWPCS